MSNRILIIGAGLSGLTFANGLKKSGIPFQVFEGDTSPTFRAQGYRIRINEEGAESLKVCLSPELFAEGNTRVPQAPLPLQLSWMRLRAYQLPPWPGLVVQDAGHLACLPAPAVNLAADQLLQDPEGLQLSDTKPTVW